MSLPLLGGGSGHGSGGGGGGTSFTPINLTGLIGWWDASVTASLSLSGSNILTVADQSGSGNTMGQQGAINRPTYSATGINTSFPAMVFATASSQVLENNTPFPFGTGNTLTMFAVATMTSSAPSNARLFSYSATGVGHDFNSALSFTLTRNTTNNSLVWVRNSTNTSAAALALSTPKRIIVTVASTGATIIYIDGVSAGTGTIGGNFGNPGGALNIGGGHFDATYWDGAVGEIGIATGFTNSTDAGSLDLYLKNKWGL